MGLNLNGARLEESVFLPVLAGNNAAMTAQTGSNAVIVEGDFVWWDATNGTIQPASKFTWDTDGATTRRKFKRVFCGVAGDSLWTDSPLRVMKVYSYAEIDVSVAAGNFAPGDLIAPMDASSLLQNQTIKNVTNDATQAIGKTDRVFSANVTTARVCIQSTLFGIGASGVQTPSVMTLSDGQTVATTTVVNAVPAYQLFGGPVEVLSVGGVVGVNLATNTAYVATMSPCTTTLTIPAGSTRGTYVEQSLAADPNRVLEANTLVTVQPSAVPSSGAINDFLIRYRPLF